MSGPSDSVSPSPSPSNTSGSGGGSAFKSRIAAFESGAAANASKRDQSKQIQHADLSNLRSRFDREGEKPLEVKGSFGLGAAPLRAPGEHGHAAQQGRAVSLGAGRAVAPTQSPLVVLPSPSMPASSPARTASSSINSAAAGASGGLHSPARAASSSSTSNAARPVSTRSDSTNSASTSATSTSLSGATATSTASSLLPGPLAALRGSAASGASASSSTGGGDDLLSAGLRTPMSSVSLSSMMVETGSIAGEAESSSGDTTANEDERAPVGGKILGGSDDETATTPIEEPTTPGMRADTNEGEDEDSLQLSAAALEKRKALDKAAAQSNDALESKPMPKKTPSVISEGGRSVDSAQPPKDAVDRAAAELDKYTHEEPSQTAVMSPPPIDADASGTASMSTSASVPRLDMPAQEPSTSQHEADFAHKLPSPPPTASARKSPSRPGSGLYTSPTDRLKRSSTAGSIHSVASHPESDLADTNLENFDDEVADSSKAAAVADSIAPPPADARQASDAPIADAQGTAEVSANADNVPQDDISSMSIDKQDFAPVNADESVDEVDEEGMPLVKCSDCHAKVSLVKLGEHVCSAPAPPPPASASTVAFPSIGSGSEGRPSLEGVDTFAGGLRDRRETGPEDVPTSDFSPSPIPSPQMSHRSLASKPDVPDDEAQSVASMPVDGDDDDEPLSTDQALPARPSPARHGTTDSSVAAETDDLEEDYMTALTSRRDSEDMTSNPRPGFMSDLPESISDPRNLSLNGLSLSDPAHSSGNAGGAAEDDDEESEVLAMGMADGPVSTPRLGSFSNGSSAQQQRSVPATHPDSPTPDRGSISPTSQTPMSNRTSKLTAPQNADGGMMGAAGVRRRSSATKRNKNLGDTDSENEVEPGTVTIIR